MASINIGSLKFNWKGTYNGSTAYAVDDVTEYNGSSYICILASTGNLPTNTTYFQPMATKGTDGTDVGATLTTQGDILYRDGSGLQRLAKGTANQVLKMNAGATAPEYGNLSSDFVKLGQTGAVSDVAGVDLNNFFTSDYNIYKIYGYGIYGASAGNGFTWRAITSGGTQTGSHYIYANDGYYKSSGGNGSNSNHAFNETHGCRLAWSGGGSGYENSVEMTVYEPLSTTAYKKIHFISAGWDGSATFVGMTGAGTWRQTTALTGINFHCFSGNMWADNFVIYGIKA